MNHYYRNIKGWFDFQSIYSDAVKGAKDGDHFVEVGCYLGKSTAFMAVEIINSGKQILFDCVDTWEGKEWGVYDQFADNTQKVSGAINIIRKPSTEAAKDYADNSLDFVFIDADHEYESVVEDINAWHPKVKIGGVLAGHDYHLNHPGVIRAVNELLKTRIILLISWKYIKS